MCAAIVHQPSSAQFARVFCNFAMPINIEELAFSCVGLRIADVWMVVAHGDLPHPQSWSRGCREGAGERLPGHMAEALVNFLARMAFLLANDGRDADVAALRVHTLALLSEALGLWPTVRSSSAVRSS